MKSLFIAIFNFNSMDRYLILLSAGVLVLLSSCGKFGKSKGIPNDGQLYGEAPTAQFKSIKPNGMVYIPPGMFHMGPSDEDVNYAFTARNKRVSIEGFWMDATAITNNEYRQFTNWVRDSIAATLLDLTIDGGDNTKHIDWKQARNINYSDENTLEKIDAIILTPDNRIFGKKEIDPKKIVYHSEVFNFKEAAKRENANQPRSSFIVKYDIPVYPDTLVWIRDFAYSYNEPQTRRYNSHPAFGNYPVVGVTWKQATAFAEWRTMLLNNYLENHNRASESPFRLPTEAEWEYAARGGRSQAPYPWGGPYLRNRKGCLMANFKPGRGDYIEDGGFYTVRADAYMPNDFGLYQMSGNVAEWTSSLYYEGSYNFQHDMNPDIRWDAAETDPPRMKRKVIRGGSWKDVGYYLQTSTRSYEYQDTAKSYIGFRCVTDINEYQKRRRR